MATRREASGRVRLVKLCSAITASSRYVDFGALELQVHGMAVEQSTNIKIDMRQTLVVITGLETRPEDLNDLNGMAQRAGQNPIRPAEDENALGMSEVTSILRMRLTNLKCYGLPGEASKLTSWP